MKLPQQPLAYRVRPQSLCDFVGQSHLLGSGKLIERMLSQKVLYSLLLCGAPGIGKTTLAQLLAQHLGYHFEHKTATESGVKEIKNIAEQAQQRLDLYQQSTLLFLDEIHRFNKSQQDVLLPYVESGLIVLVGATTENPYFSINDALLSRMRVVKLRALSVSELQTLIEKTLQRDVYYQRYCLRFEQGFFDRLAQASHGDTRQAITLVESILLSKSALLSKGLELSCDDLTQLGHEHGLRFDQNADQFYDQLSAFHKSVRGSDPDAAIFWLVSMLEYGADPSVIARRMICIASEDIGLADPKALSIAVDAWNAFERMGMPEGRLPLSQAAIYLAVAPKSNAAYKAYSEAASALKNIGSNAVPSHLKTHSKHYQYAHDYPQAYVVQQYLPDDLANVRFYHPTQHGLEIKIKQKLAMLDEIKRGC